MNENEPLKDPSSRCDCQRVFRVRSSELVGGGLVKDVDGDGEEEETMMGSDKNDNGSRPSAELGSNSQGLP